MTIPVPAAEPPPETVTLTSTTPGVTLPAIEEVSVEPPEVELPALFPLPVLPLAFEPLVLDDELPPGAEVVGVSNAVEGLEEAAVTRAATAPAATPMAKMPPRTAARTPRRR